MEELGWGALACALGAWALALRAGAAGAAVARWRGGGLVWGQVARVQLEEGRHLVERGRGAARGVALAVHQLEEHRRAPAELLEVGEDRLRGAWRWEAGVRVEREGEV